MPTGRSLRFALVACAPLTVLGQVDAASACSIDPCVPPVRLPSTSEMPGNLVYFEVTADAPGSITLRTAAGEPIPAGIRTIGSDRVFTPDAPIAEATDVVLEFELACSGDAVASGRGPGTFEFRTYNFRSVVLAPARLFVREYGVSDPGIESYETAFVRLGMDSPDVNHTATHLMTHTATVDGQVVSRWPMLGELERQLSIQSSCQPRQVEADFDSCDTLWTVPVGRHTVTVQTRVLGHEEAIAPVTIEVETTCPEAEDEPDASCAFGSGTASSSTSAALALLALGTLAGRRRRSQR